ncbi:ion transporter [Salsipaludibacter albus]|uniref:ion transporter n=1 Tax=Salsipaludibacter albus TaxID=2849650 RepID=UPI001EE45771|nr:ion transporter [Salsipaludibacter albus]MBY5163679.1 ion transporter [Salsipaludibacter albus]
MASPPTSSAAPSDEATLRERLRRIIFEADTPAGKAFDVVLLVLIVASVLLVMWETVPGVREENRQLIVALEWVVTALFTLEYLARLWTAPSARGYARSFFGVIDLLSVLPVYLALVVPGAQSLLVVRSLRLMRVFRVFKMAHFLRQANFLLDAVRSSARKIAVFLLSVVLINVIVGSTMYVIEGAANGFDSMFRGVYWSIVTMSTVGFGDIAPQTGLGQVLAAALMIMGYSVIAVPTGIVSAEVASARAHDAPQPTCPACGWDDHDVRAVHCQRCGAVLHTAPAADRSPAADD